MINDDNKKFLDEAGKIKYWLSKYAKQDQILRYLSGRFIPDRIYTEAEVNEIIENNHSFGDLFILRRGMIEARLLTRKPNGSEYWKTKNTAE